MASMISRLVGAGSRTTECKAVRHRSIAAVRRAPAVLAAGVVLGLASLGPTASPAAAAVGGCEEHGGVGCGLTGQYSGKWEAEKVETRTKQVITKKVRLTWSEYFDGRYWVLSSAGGTFSCTSVGEYGVGGCKGNANIERSSCSGTLSVAGGGAAAFRQAQVQHIDLAGVGGFGTEPYISHNDPSNRQPFSKRTWYVSLAPPLRSTLLIGSPSYRYEELIHSSETEPGSPCASSATERNLDAAWTVPSGQWASRFGGAGCHYVGGEVGIDWVSFPAGSSHTATDGCAGSATEGSITGTAALTASITFSSPGSSSGGTVGGGKGLTPYGPEFSKAKREALRDMREEAVPNAMHYCIDQAAALGVGVAGVLTTGLGPGGGILAAAGSLTASTLGPFCDATIKRAVRDWKGYNDPPLASIYVLARPTIARAAGLPSCGSYRGQAGSFCNRLRAADAKLLAAAQRTASVARALEMTISREHAAHQAHNRAAVAAQDAHLRVLLREQRRAAAAERSAGKSVARALKTGRIRFRITKEQSANVIATAERAAAAQGVTVANLRRANARALMPAAANLLAALERL